MPYNPNEAGIEVKFPSHWGIDSRDPGTAARHFPSQPIQNPVDLPLQSSYQHARSSKRMVRSRDTPFYRRYPGRAGGSSHATRSSYSYPRNRMALDRASCLAGRKPEVKYLDLVLATDVNDTAGVVTALSIIPQGSSSQTRNGRRCMVTSVSLQGHYGHVDGLTGSLPNAYFDRLRFMLVQDRAPNGALPAVSDILAAADVDAYRNLDNPSRFVMLAEKNVVVNPRVISGSGAATWGQVAQRYPLRMHADVCIDMEFTDAFTTGVISTQVLNSILFVAIADQGTATNVQFQARLRFVD